MKLRYFLESVWPVTEDELVIEIPGDKCDMGSDDLILAIAKVPEKYIEVADALHNIVQDTQSLTEITVNG